MSQAVLNLIAKKALKDVAGKKEFNSKVCVLSTKQPDFFP